MAFLVAQTGPLSGSAIPILNGRLIIGRAVDCDLQLPDPRVSRHHCAVHFDGRRLRIRDLGSRSGTLVNQRRIGMVESNLHHGDLVAVLESVFRVDLEAT
jgi:pSer/pThr/pTyr-binding forkhead associated (FHA) protein